MSCTSCQDEEVEEVVRVIELSIETIDLVQDDKQEEGHQEDMW
jgi:hypothetical protein